MLTQENARPSMASSTEPGLTSKPSANVGSPSARTFRAAPQPPPLLVPRLHRRHSHQPPARRPPHHTPAHQCPRHPLSLRGFPRTAHRRSTVAAGSSSGTHACTRSQTCTLACRRSPSGWFKATDSLEGTAVYGDAFAAADGDKEMSVHFAEWDFDEFLFTTGDCKATHTHS